MEETKKKIKKIKKYKYKKSGGARSLGQKKKFPPVHL